MHVSSTASAQRRKHHHAVQPENQTWDPGAVQEQYERNKLCETIAPEHLHSLSSASMVSAANVSEGEPDIQDSRAEMDSHANMPVVGRNACMTSDTGRIADVNAFTADCDSMMMSIVDASVRSDCPCDGQACVFVMRNALHVPSMKNNLVPPFMMREAGITANATPKIQAIKPTKEDHSTCFPESDFRIPLSSCFQLAVPEFEASLNPPNAQLIVMDRCRSDQHGWGYYRLDASCAALFHLKCDVSTENPVHLRERYNL
jgi:hypothetical protein